MRAANEEPRERDHGTTINCHPILTAETVQHWFRQTCDRLPCPDDAARLAATINHYDFLSALWKESTLSKTVREDNQSLLRMRRIGKALTTLQMALPEAIDDARKVLPPGAQDTGLNAVISLLDSVKILAPGFQKFVQRGRGRKPSRWHHVAHELRPLIVAALNSAGFKQAGFGKETSPAVKIMKLAFEHLCHATSEAAIVEAMRARPPRTKKGVGK
jgi:hypothetical protein